MWTITTLTIVVKVMYIIVNVSWWNRILMYHICFVIQLSKVLHVIRKTWWNYYSYVLYFLVMKLKKDLFHKSFEQILILMQ